MCSWCGRDDIHCWPLHTWRWSCWHPEGHQDTSPHSWDRPWNGDISHNALVPVRRRSRGKVKSALTHSRLKQTHQGEKTIISVEKNLRQLWNDSTWVTSLQEMTNKVRRNKRGLVFIYLFMCLNSHSVLLPNFLQVDRIYSCAWWQVRHEGHICGAATLERWYICWSHLYMQTDWKRYFDRNNSESPSFWGVIGITFGRQNMRYQKAEDRNKMNGGRRAKEKKILYGNKEKWRGKRRLGHNTGKRQR